jgi:alpha-tubulin suppressor-like RCC1 family protein
MTTNFRFNNGGTQTDFDDAFINKDLFASGGLWLWGSNYNGQLGDNTTIEFRASPVQTISGGINWRQVAPSACIKTDGTLWLWGKNNYGQLGINNTLSRSSPVQTISGGTNWKQVSRNNGTLGVTTSGAIKTDGTLWLWGDNSWFQCGDGSFTNRSSPVQTISTGANWQQVSCGALHTAAIKTDGTLWTWGINGLGQLGDGTSSFARSTPGQTISAGTNWRQVSTSQNINNTGHTACVKTDGTLWLWGDNVLGQLGTNDTLRRSSPVQTISGGTNWKQVSCGNQYTGCTKTDGTLWLWGANYDGGLGTNDRTARSSPVQTISAGTNWKLVSCGTYITASIKTDGTLWLWGQGIGGGLGNNTITPVSSPVQTVAGGTNWQQAAAANRYITAFKNDF